MENLNYRPNSKLIKLKISLLAMIFFAAGNFFVCSRLNAAEVDETIRILERWTSAHWGQDCFVWVVHYPEELITPWVEAEALRSGMSDAQRENFRKDFVSRLKLDTSETFLVSVYSFGSRPVNLSPVRENISLFTATGERISPKDFDSNLEYPAAGVVQGLVFFPKQSNKDYVIGLRGMGRTERVFSFSPPETPAPAPTPAPKQEKKNDVVVVNLPKKQPAKKPEPEPDPEPIPPPLKLPPQPAQEQDMAAFVSSMQKKNNNTQSQTQTPAPRPALNNSSNSENSYVSRESVLRRFLMFFANNQPNEMYDMLSDNSRRQISRENFAKEIARASDFRDGLKNDYRLDWIGEERAKVTTTFKNLFFKSVASRTFGITREGSSWRVVW